MVVASLPQVGRQAVTVAGRRRRGRRRRGAREKVGIGGHGRMQRRRRHDAHGRALHGHHRRRRDAPSAQMKTWPVNQSPTSVTRETGFPRPLVTFRHIVFHFQFTSGRLNLTSIPRLSLTRFLIKNPRDVP